MEAMATSTPSSAISTTSAPSTKAPRILACVLCQHRKIKCDRNFPCANCTKVSESHCSRHRSRPAALLVTVATLDRGVLTDDE